MTISKTSRYTLCLCAWASRGGSFVDVALRCYLPKRAFGALLLSFLIRTQLNQNSTSWHTCCRRGAHRRVYLKNETVQVVIPHAELTITFTDTNRPSGVTIIGFLCLLNLLFNSPGFHIVSPFFFQSVTVQTELLRIISSRRASSLCLLLQEKVFCVV